jgi:uncharacterized protein YjiS (DUF1127 family)
MTSDIVKAGEAVHRSGIERWGRSAFASLWTRLRTRRQRRKTTRYVDMLSTAALKDIGLRRVDLTLIAFNTPGYLRPDRYL